LRILNRGAAHGAAGLNQKYLGGTLATHNLVIARQKFCIGGFIAAGDTGPIVSRWQHFVKSRCEGSSVSQTGLKELLLQVCVGGVNLEGALDCVVVTDSGLEEGRCDGRHKQLKVCKAGHGSSCGVPTHASAADSIFAASEKTHTDTTWVLSDNENHVICLRINFWNTD